jgi:SAM-dependent methyltransferase
MLSAPALALVLRLPDVSKVLDVGSGEGAHSEILSKVFEDVRSVDINPRVNPTYLGDFVTSEVSSEYDLVWASHVLEHQPNVNMFLTKCFDILKEGGYLAVTVPPLKHEVVGGHLTLWNPGVLLYNLILAGFDCGKAKVRTEGYNISVVVKKKSFDMPRLNYDFGDIETLSRYFPFKARQGFDGRIASINWDV